MKKNPGRKERRNLVKRNRTMKSDKKQAINERKMLRLSKYGPMSIDKLQGLRCKIAPVDERLSGDIGVKFVRNKT